MGREWSGQGSFRERSPVGSRLSESLFLNVLGTATEQVWTCGLRRNSSSLDKEPKMRDSVRLNSFESFLVTLPSISSETWKMYLWAIPRSSVFCHWLFLVLSDVSLETAANFLLFLKVAMIMRKKFCQLQRLNWSFLYIATVLVSYNFEGEASRKTKQLMISTKVKYQKATNLYNNNSTFESRIYTLFLVENTIAYTPKQGTNREKYFIPIIYKAKNANSGWKRNTSPSISSFMDRAFSIFQREKYGSNPSEMDIKVVIPASTQTLIT